MNHPHIVQGICSDYGSNPRAEEQCRELMNRSGNWMYLTFLPSPKELALKKVTEKVKISLSKSSVEFFKTEAWNNKTRYQKMIRRMLDVYTDAHKKSITSQSS
ncbi:MAG: hypothetical protein ACYTEE_09325 [Planctomycetota bacterium]|jgi:hypothetical protein